MSIQGIFYIAAHVSDLERSKRFYSETLGWKIETDAPGVAGLRFGTGYVVLLEEQKSGDAETRAGGMHVAVQVDDIDGEHAKLAAAGVAVSEVITQPWGERNFSFKDPDGYEWSYGAIVRQP